MKWLVPLMETIPAYVIDPKGYVQGQLDDRVKELARAHVRARLSQGKIMFSTPEARAAEYKNQLAITAPKYTSAVVEVMKL